MNAYVLELLYPTGWRRSSELHWRYTDATEAAMAVINDMTVRAARVLPVRVQAIEVFSVERPVSSDVRPDLGDSSVIDKATQDSEDGEK